MRYFDFLFYLVHRFYSGYREKGAESTASGIVGGLPVLNIIMAIMLFQLSYQHKAYVDKLLVVILFIIFQVLAFYRYNYLDRYSAKEIEKRWQAQSKALQDSIRAVLAIYGVLSVAGTFGLAIYLGQTS